jgi:ABC-2 type transport system permease protein
MVLAEETALPPVTRRATGTELFLRSVFARAYPRLIGQHREPSWLFFDIFLPLVATCAYVFVYKAIGAPEDFIGFVIVGGAMTAFWLNVLWGMSSQLFWEKETGNLSLYVMAPNSMMSILLGMALGGMLSTCLRALVVIALGSLWFGVRYAIHDVWALAAVFALAMTALYGMGMLFASLFLLFGREAWHTSNMLQEPIYLASGFYFPVSSLNFWVAAGASIIPLTLGLDAMRQLLFASGATFGFLSVRAEIAALIVLCILFLTTAKFALTFMERKAIAEGKITDTRK